MFYIIDGSSLLTTMFFANLPKEIMFAKEMSEKEKYFYKILKSSKGVYTNAIYGFFRTFMKILREQKPEYLAVCWDKTRDTFRRRIYPDYKGNRAETLEPLKQQFELCQEMLEKMNVKQFSSDEYEADDFSGTLSKLFENSVKVGIMTKDNDYLQLASENTTILMMHSSADKTKELYDKYNMRHEDYPFAPERTFPFTPELIKKEFGVDAVNINSLKALMGDASDNIKGVPGIGPATATALIAKYKTVDGLYSELHGKNEKELKELAASFKTELSIKRSPINYLIKESDTELVGEKAARLSEMLATIKRDIELDVSLEDLRLNINREAAIAEFDELEFKSSEFRNFDGKNEEEKKDEDSSLYNPFEDSNDGQLSFFGETEAENGGNEKSKSKSKSKRGGEALRIDAKKSDSFYKIIPAKEDICARAKVEIKNALHGGEKIEELSLKTLTEEMSSYAGKKLKKAAFYVDKNKVMIAFEENEAIRLCVAAYSEKDDVFELLGKLTDAAEAVYMSDIYSKLSFYVRGEAKDEILKADDVSLAAYLVSPGENEYDAVYLADKYLGIKLEEMIGKKDIPAEIELLVLMFAGNAVFDNLDRLGERKLYDEVEKPLINVLYNMHVRGIKTDKEFLESYSKELTEKIDELEGKIHKAVGKEFNINSPKQLGAVLFEDLKLEGGKKTKSGYSTAAEVLKPLADKYTVVSDVLEYRKYSKLRSTYADGFIPYIAEDGRIHGNFNQMIAATGRLSSTEPNLQNIPARSDEGMKIREAFIPKEGYVFVDADYSQIELRVLADMSGDEKLIEAYNKDSDIHKITASEVFHVPLDEVTKTMRSRAKAVNFGIVYGISSYGLGESLEITRDEAEGYIESYFKIYKKVEAYMDELVRGARSEGFTRTKFGRIRVLPDINDKNYLKRTMSERMAKNSPIQGTAADIIKIAMLNVEKRLLAEKLDARLLLQIHDELLVEVRKDEEERVREVMKEEMEKAAVLSVPLIVSISSGQSLFEAK